MTQDEEVKVLEQSIKELQRTYDEISEAYNIAKTKTLTFLGGGLAFLSYLYNGGDLFIPHERYGIIFYFAGLSLYVVSMALLFLTTRPVNWEVPVDSDSFEGREFKSYLVFLETVKESYSNVIKINVGHQNKKQASLNLAFSMLLAGAILLLIIKNF